MIVVCPTGVKNKHELPIFVIFIVVYSS